MIPSFRSMTKGQVKKKGKGNSFVMPVTILVGLFLIGQAAWLKENKHMFRPFSTMRINCEICYKTGVIRNESDERIKIMCPSCLGVGYHMIRRFDELDAICPACGGIGRTDVEGDWAHCERCDGRGLFRLKAWKDIIDLDKMDFESNKIIREPGPDKEFDIPQLQDE